MESHLDCFPGLFLQAWTTSDFEDYFRDWTDAFLDRPITLCYKAVYIEVLMLMCVW